MTNVLITGASSGIGRATALRLQRHGVRVFAGVRDPSDIADLAGDPRQLVQAVELDVTDDGSVTRAVKSIADQTGDAGLAGLVNNAGAGFPGPLETLDIDEIRQQLEVNLLGQIRVTQAALPMLRRGRGRIVFVGSIGGKVAFEFAGAYHASKYAIEAVADVWRQELHPDGIDVVVIEPGPMSTGIWDKARERIDQQIADPSPALDRYRSRLSGFRDTLGRADESGADPAQAARTIEHALTAEHASTHYPVGLPAKAASALRQVVPERVWDRFARRAAH